MAELFDIITYDFNKEADILDIPDTFTPVVSTTVSAAPAGVYELGFSVAATLPNITNSAEVRYRVNQLTWITLSKEPKDVTDELAFYYAFPFPWAGGNLTIEVEARKTGSTDPYDIQYADSWIERKR